VIFFVQQYFLLKNKKRTLYKRPTLAPTGVEGFREKTSCFFTPPRLRSLTPPSLAAIPPAGRRSLRGSPPVFIFVQQCFLIKNKKKGRFTSVLL